MGSLFKKKKKLADGTYKEYSTYTYKFYHNGKQVFYATGETNKRRAKDNALAYESEVKKGQTPWVYNKVTFEDLKEGIILDYEVNNKKSLRRLMSALANLTSYLNGYKAKNITTDVILKYQKHRQDAGAYNATINRELSALKRMFNLAARQTPPKVAQVPYIPMLKENNVRTGFFENADFQALKKSLPQYLKGFATFAYRTGVRWAELADMKWEQVDLENRIIRLEVGTTKSDEGRIIPLDNELHAIVKQKRREWMANGCTLDYIFPNRDGTGQIRQIRRAWLAACKKAGIGKRLFHDFRRTAIRNMIRAGVPEQVAMKISGHKTRSTFERYNIVNERDVQEAMIKTGEYLKGQKTEEKQKVIHLKAEAK
jgi:integrase